MKWSWLSGDKKIVPMVMFHSVGLENHDWEYRHIAEPLHAFEDKVAKLAHAGFNFITWGELYAYMRGEHDLELPAIVLTFDDGYLDNWVYAYPILKKYGAKGTIFVSPDFVDPSEDCRPNLEDVARGACKATDLQLPGFLNWEEMREMERSGVIDIQSHAKSHTWYASGPDPVDFWKPGQNEHCWMAWNERPERKPFYLNENQWDFVALGTPVYEHAKALTVRRFFASEEIGEGMQRFMDGHGGPAIFDVPDCFDRLRCHHSLLLEKWRKACRYETEEERRERTYVELSEGKQEIEKHLGKIVNFICWPGGGYDAVTLELAQEVGFKSWTLGSSDQTAVRNLPGGDAQQIKRIGSSPRQVWRGRQLGFTMGDEFLCLVKEHQGSVVHKWTKRARKLLRISGMRA